MARIELRYCTIILQDGLGLPGSDGVTMPTAKVATTAAAASATSLTLNDVVIPRAAVTTKVPVGARFTLASELGNPIHVVTARTMDTTGLITTAITFSPPLVAATTAYAIGDVLTILSQQLEIKIGEGNCTYTEKKEYKYDLERGNLDAVREGNEVPVDMKFECVYEHITTGTGEQLCPMDALKGEYGAAEWVTSGPDPCEPHAVEVTITYTPPCSGQDIEITSFPDFRVESRAIDYSKAMISVAGKCNITQAVVTRVPQTSPQPI